jgi:catechol 2,3-dioxygenase-like lactoylglutathione lyase family enzyme
VPHPAGSGRRLRRTGIYLTYGRNDTNKETEPMEIKKLYHLTLLVEDLAEAEAFYAQVFSPLCFMRGYAPFPLHRDAALLAIADTVIEPMQPLPPESGQKATSIYRFLDRFGPRVHSLALLVSGADELAARFEAAGVHWTNGGMDNHVFPHPKDFPGLLELADFGDRLERFSLPDPRLRSQYDQAYWRDAHPLGIAFTSHYTLVVRDHDDAANRYIGLLDAKRLPDQPSSTSGARSAYVALSDGTVIELAEPIDSSCPFADDLTNVGETWCGLTFRVVNTRSVAAYLDRQGVPIHSNDGTTIVLDRAHTFQVHHAFTSEALIGDVRANNG